MSRSQYRPAAYNPYPGGASWPGPPPFSGAPPMPNGLNISQQRWQGGYWYPNAAYNPASQPGRFQQWIPSQAWQQPQPQQQQQQAASHNPYKRVPRPPSAEYLASKLSDNPLGLTNMIPAYVYSIAFSSVDILTVIDRENLYGDEDEDKTVAPQTPWIWKPQTLEGETIEGTPPNGSGPDPSSSATNRNRSTSQTRHASDPSPSNTNRDSGVSRGYSEPVPGRVGSIDDSHPSFVGSLDRPKAYPRSTDPATPERQQSAPKEPETFTAKRELKPTFSMNIIRTPEYYQSSPSRNSSRNSTDSQLSSRMSQLSIGSSNGSSSRQSSVSSPGSPEYVSPSSSTSTVSGVSALSDEPVSILSPLMMVNTPKPTSRSIARHSSVPVVGSSILSTIPEAPTTFTPPRNGSRHTSYVETSATPSPRSRSSSRPSSRPASRPTSQQTSPVRSASFPDWNPPPNSAPATSSRLSGGSGDWHTPPPPHSANSASQRSNPLPAPPQEIRHSTIPPTQTTPPQHWRERVRKGFWNRRGDHLTMSGYVVYAPPEKAYPPELRNYPQERVSYRDEIGNETPYVERPELPESLPRHGNAPEQPYEVVSHSLYVLIVILTNVFL